MRKALEAYYDAGFLRIADSHDEGGMGMPETIAFSCNEIFTAASLSFFTYPILGHGNATLLRNFGTDGQRSLYLDNILSGRWGGTMCLTEPGAGSDVGALRTKATRLPDGSFPSVDRRRYLERRRRHLRKHHTFRARAHRGRSGRDEGHIAFHRSQVPGAP